MSQRFTLDRESFEQFIAAVSLFQSLQQAAANRSEENAPLLLYLLETLRGIDSGELAVQAALERVAGLALQIVGGDGAVLWLFTSEKLICRAAAGRNFEDDRIRTALRSKLRSAGAFGEDPPAKLDLTRTFESYAASLGSSLVIAILPGGKTAGALAVFSVQSMTFTKSHYANLRLLAGLAQYVLTRQVEGRKPQDLLDDSPEENPETSAFLALQATSSTKRSARDPFFFHRPSSEHIQRGEIEDLHLASVGARIAFGGDMNERPRIGTGLQPLLASAALESRKRMQRLKATVLNATENSLRRFRDVRVNWRALKEAVPAIAILAVISFFVGLLTGGRTPLGDSSMNATAEAATQVVTHNSSKNVGKPAAAILIAKKAAAVPMQASHLQITDRETAATIAELSKFEVPNLHRAADYGDDEAALQLGMLYELGRGFPQSCRKAAEWVTKAAQNGNAAAEYNLGLRYRDGDGVDANIQQAENLLRKAAAHKNSNAGRALAELLSQYPETSVGKITETSEPVVRTR